jgi:hypothetical protein
LSQTYEDPFAAQVLTAEGPTPEDIVVSFRPYDSNSAPTVTVRGKTWPEVADKLGVITEAAAGGALGNAHAALKATYAAAVGLDATPTQSPAAAQQSYQQPNGAQNGYQAPQGGYQQPQQQPNSGRPPGPAPQCPHGEKNFVPAGTNASGKAYGAFWGCPAPRNAPDKCRPQWIQSR